MMSASLSAPHSVPTPNRLLVGIAGIPASGKSEFAVLVNRYTNALLEDRDEKATLVGLDGWHLTRAQLDAMSDPKLAHDKRVRPPSLSCSTFLMSIVVGCALDLRWRIIRRVCTRS